MSSSFNFNKMSCHVTFGQVPFISISLPPMLPQLLVWFRTEVKLKEALCLPQGTTLENGSFQISKFIREEKWQIKLALNEVFSMIQNVMWSLYYQWLYGSKTAPTGASIGMKRACVLLFELHYSHSFVIGRHHSASFLHVTITWNLCTLSRTVQSN